MSEDRAPQPLSVALERLLGTMNAPPADVLSAVFSRWSEVVGPDLAKHCRPTAIDDDRLVITASDSTWASELRWLEQMVIARVAEVAGEQRIKSVSVRVDSRQPRGPRW